MKNARIAFDESTLMKDDGSPIVDSSKAHRILSGCIKSLSADDLVTVAECLKDKGLIDDGELKDVQAAVQDGGPEDDDSESGMASDSAIMANRRRQVAAGTRPASCLREPIERPMTAKQQKDFEERFPDMNRIKLAY